MALFRILVAGGVLADPIFGQASGGSASTVCEHGRAGERRGEGIKTGCAGQRGGTKKRSVDLEVVDRRLLGWTAAWALVAEMLGVGGAPAGSTVSVVVDAVLAARGRWSP